MTREQMVLDLIKRFSVRIANHPKTRRQWTPVKVLKGQ